MKNFAIRALAFISLWAIFLLGNFLINQNFIKNTPLPCAKKEGFSKSRG